MNFFKLVVFTFLLLTSIAKSETDFIPDSGASIKNYNLSDYLNFNPENIPYLSEGYVDHSKGAYAIRSDQQARLIFPPNWSKLTNLKTDDGIPIPSNPLESEALAMKKMIVEILDEKILEARFIDEIISNSSINYPNYINESALSSFLVERRGVKPQNLGYELNKFHREASKKYAKFKRRYREKWLKLIRSEPLPEYLGVSEAMDRFANSSLKSIGVSEAMDRFADSSLKSIEVSEAMDRFADSSLKSIEVSEAMGRSADSSLKSIEVSEAMGRSAGPYIANGLYGAATAALPIKAGIITGATWGVAGTKVGDVGREALGGYGRFIDKTGKNPFYFDLNQKPKHKKSVMDSLGEAFNKLLDAM